MLREYENPSNKVCVFGLIVTVQHIHTLVSCSCIYIYIYIYRERERERERERVGKILKLRICIWNWEIKNKTSRKIYVKLKYEIFLQWNTKFSLVFLVFHWRKISYFNFIYISALVLLFISKFHMHILKLARWFLLILKS